MHSSDFKKFNSMPEQNPVLFKGMQQGKVHNIQQQKNANYQAYKETRKVNQNQVKIY